MMILDSIVDLGALAIGAATANSHFEKLLDEAQEEEDRLITAACNRGRWPACPRPSCGPLIILSYRGNSVIAIQNCPRSQGCAACTWQHRGQVQEESLTRIRGQAIDTARGKFRQGVCGRKNCSREICRLALYYLNIQTYHVAITSLYQARTTDARTLVCQALIN
jgi:hypothetical protein